MKNKDPNRQLNTIQKLAETQESILTIDPESQLKDILQAIAESANSVLGGDFCVVQPYLQTNDEFQVDHFTAGGNPKARTFQWREPRKDGTARNVLERGILIIEDYDEAINNQDNYPFLRTAQSSQTLGAFKDIADVKAYLGVRLEVRNEVVGVLFIDYLEPRVFSEDEILIARIFAGQAAIAIKNIRTYALLNTLQNVGNTISSMLNKSEVIDVVLSAIYKSLGFEYATVSLVDDEKLIIETVQGIWEGKLGKNPEWLEKSIYPLDHWDIIPDIARSMKTEVIDKWDNRFNKAIWDQFNHERLIRVFMPLQIGDKAIGVIETGFDKKNKREIGREDIRILQTFTAQASIAIENANIYEDIKNQTNNLSNLLNIANELSEALTDPNVILQTTLRRAVEMLDVTRGGIVYHEGNSGVVVASYEMGEKKEQPIGERFSNSNLQEHIRKDRKPILIENIETNELLGEDEKNIFLRLNIKSSLIIPLIARGRVLGSLGLDETRRRRKFTEREVELARILANIVANAIDNARLYEVAEEELAAVLEVSGKLVQKALQSEIVLTEFYEDVIQQTLELMEFNAGWLLIKEGNLVRIVATDKQHAKDQGRLLAIDGSISGKCITKKQLINLPDLEDIPGEYKTIYQAPLGPQAMKSELVVPLIVGGEAIGAFNIESERKNAFGTQHEEMLKLLSGYVGLALELARLRHETNALASIGLELSRETEMDAVVKSVLNHALSLVEGQFGQVLIRKEGLLEVRWSTNDPPTDIGSTVKENDSVSGLAIIEKKPIIVSDVDKPDYFVVEFLEGQIGKTSQLLPRKTERSRYKRALEAKKARMHAELALPLFASGTDIIGVLNVETPNESGFSLEQQKELTEYAKVNGDQFAQALLPKLQHDALEELLKGALVRAETDFGQILLQEGSDLLIVHTSGEELTHPQGKGPITLRVSINNSISGRVIKAKESIYIQDVEQDPDYQRYLGEEMKSELVVPLMSGDNIIGVLNIESPKLDYFNANHARLLEAFAGQAAVAIDRAKKFQGITLSEIGAIAGDVVHRLNNPLGAIGTRIELFNEKYKDELVNDQYLKNFISRTERDLNTAKDIIRELRSTYKKGVPTPIDLNDAIFKALEKAELSAEINVVTNIKEGAKVIASERLSYVLWNIVDNGRKAIEKAKRSFGSLEIEVTDEGAWKVIRISDNGIGIPPAQVDLIWDPDITTTSDANAPAHGLGLYWTKAMIENYGGEITVDSKVGIGTSFTIRLLNGNRDENEQEKN